VADELAVVRLPPVDIAPAYRDSLATLSRFVVTDLGAGLVTVTPAAGAGAVEEHFIVHEICDRTTDLADPATWAPLRENPPRVRAMADAEAYRDRMLERAQEFISMGSDRPEAQFTAFAMMAFGAAEVGEIDLLLQARLPGLFESFPDGRLLYVTVSDRLLARLAFARTQAALELVPDIQPGEEMDQLRAFSELTLTQGIDSTAITQFPLLAFSPGALGVVIPALPHSLIFCFGSALDLRRAYPQSFSSLFRPRVLNDPAGLDRQSLFEGERPDDGPQLVGWWAHTLNQLYSHVTDPTRWTDADGYYDGARQTAWLVTLERLLGDALTLMAEPQATELDRVQMAFDLLDKAEALMGYGRDQSGRGFAWLLRRSEALPRIKRALLSSLPEDLGERLGAEAARLYDALYEQVRENTLNHRVTPNGARIARGAPENLQSIDNDTLVSNLCRAVRNSSHGLLNVLRSHDDRFLLAANTGGIPAELPALAPLMAMALVADAPALNNGTWRTGATA
jgi:hypothetical protein